MARHQILRNLRPFVTDNDLQLTFIPGSVLHIRLLRSSMLIFLPGFKSGVGDSWIFQDFLGLVVVTDQSERRLVFKCKWQMEESVFKRWETLMWNWLFGSSPGQFDLDLDLIMRSDPGPVQTSERAAEVSWPGGFFTCMSVCSLMFQHRCLVSLSSRLPTRDSTTWTSTCTDPPPSWPPTILLSSWRTMKSARRTTAACRTTQLTTRSVRHRIVFFLF